MSDNRGQRGGDGRGRRPGRGNSRGRGSYEGGAQSPMSSLPNSRGNTPSPSPYSSTSDNQMTCHHCKQPGHVAKHCPQIKARKNRASERRQQEERRASQAGPAGSHPPSQGPQALQQGQQIPQQAPQALPQGQQPLRQGPSYVQQTQQPRIPNQRGKQVTQRSSRTLGSIKPGTESAGLGRWAQFGSQASQLAIDKHTRDQESIMQIAAERTSQGLAPVPGAIYHETQILRNPKGAPEISKKTFTDEPSLLGTPLQRPVVIDSAFASANPKEVLETPQQSIRTEFIPVPPLGDDPSAKQKSDPRKILAAPATEPLFKPTPVSNPIPETIKVEPLANPPVLVGQHEGQTDILKIGNISSNMPIVVGNPDFLVQDSVDNPLNLFVPSPPNLADEQQVQVDPSVDGSTPSEPKSVLANVGAYLMKKIAGPASLLSSQPAEELSIEDDPIPSIEHEPDLGDTVGEGSFERVSREKSPSPEEGADRPDPPSLAEIAANHMRQSFEQTDSDVPKRSASLSSKAFVHATKEFLDEKADTVEHKAAKPQVAKSGTSGPSDSSGPASSLKSRKPKSKEEISHGTKSHASSSDTPNTNKPIEGKTILKSAGAPSVSTTASSPRRQPVALEKQQQAVPPQGEPQDSSDQPTLGKLKESQDKMSQPIEDEMNELARGISNIARRAGMQPSEFLVGRAAKKRAEAVATQMAKHASTRGMREADYIVARLAGMFPEDEERKSDHQRPYLQSSAEYLVDWTRKHPFLSVLWLISTGIMYSFMFPITTTPLLNDVRVLSQGLVDLPKTSLLRARNAEQDLEILVKKKIPSVRTNNGAQHPCLEFLSNQVVDMEPLYQAEQSALSFIYQGMLPRIQDTLFLPEVTMYNLSSIFNEIGHASQHLANIDRRIMQHIHVLHTNVYKCATIPIVPVTIISKLAAYTQKAKRDISNSLQSLIKWLNEIQMMARVMPAGLISKVSNDEDANAQTVLTNNQPTGTVNSTVFDEHIRFIEGSLRRAQRGHKGLRDEMRRMENDVSTLARLWFTEEQVLRITMSDDWTRRLLKNSSQL